MKKIVSLLLICSLCVSLGLVFAEEEKTFALGTWNGNVFTSEFGGYTYTKPDSATLIPREEGAKGTKATAEALEK